jgi:hypothetical protein
LFRRVHIADVGVVIGTSLAEDPHPNADISIAINAAARELANGCIPTADCVLQERVPFNGGIVIASRVTHERERSVGCVAVAGIVIQKRRGSNGSVLCDGGVQQKRCSASGRI